MCSAGLLSRVNRDYGKKEFNRLFDIIDPIWNPKVQSLLKVIHNQNNKLKKKSFRNKNIKKIKTEVQFKNEMLANLDLGFKNLEDGNLISSLLQNNISFIYKQVQI